MITLNSCPNCDSKSISQFRQTGTWPHVIYEIIPGVKVGAAIITRYCVCRACGLIFQNPRMSNTELDKFYSQGYYRRTIEVTDKGMDNSELNKAKSFAGIVEQHMGKPTSHLDIGCSRGFLLEAVGASVKVGVESNVGYVTVKDIAVYPEINLVPQKSFDLVTAIQVLEHVPAPLDFLQSMAKFIGKSGYLIIQIPTWKSPGGPLRLAHLYHFEPDVLKLMCTQAGLRVIHTQFTFHLTLICKLDHK